MTVPYVFCLYALIKVVSYYDLSVLSMTMSVIGFHTKKVWVGGVKSIQFFFGFLEFFLTLQSP